jgi:5'-3' exonuclease
MYEWRMQEGLEADDLMALDATKDSNAIICTRDKDLRQVTGAWFYSWELGNQPSFGPILIEDPGTLQLSEDNKKLSGTGTIWFYAQCLIGDKVDNILGVPKIGPKRAYELLTTENGIITLDEAYKAVREAYRGHYCDNGDKAFEENAQLLWMVRELDSDNNPVMWRLKDEQ